MVVKENHLYIVTNKEMLAFEITNYFEAFETKKTMKKEKNNSEELLKILNRRIKFESKNKESLTRQIKDLEKYLNNINNEEKKAEKFLKLVNKWKISCQTPESLILSGRVLFAGGSNYVIAVNTATGEKFWEAKVNGKAKGLAVANNRLFVSTDKGYIHCFTHPSLSSIKNVSTGDVPGFNKDDGLNSSFEIMAKTIIKETNIKKGYSLFIGANAHLALSLAKHTDLSIYMVEPNADKAEEAKRILIPSGLYGNRILIEQSPLSAISYPDYFANLIIYSGLVSSTQISFPARELLRMLKPLGGIAYIGQLPGEKTDPKLNPLKLKEWLKELNDSNIKITMTGKTRAVIKRGKLKGAGSWTHQYANPGNTTCGDDTFIKGPLGVLWFGEPGPGEMAERHMSAASPLSINGRLFVQGRDVIMAYDAYNGILLWKRKIPGVVRLGLREAESSNLVASEDSLLWEYVALKGNLLFGSYSMNSSALSDIIFNPDLKRTQASSEYIFAINIETGKTQWIYRGKDIRNSSIAIGDNKLFLVDKDVTDTQRVEAFKEKLQNIKGKYQWLKDNKGKVVIDVRNVIALDTKTGKKLWEKPMDFSDCVKIAVGGGTLSAIYSQKVLLIFAAPWNGHFWSDFMRGNFSRRSIIAISGDTGEILWSDWIGYRSRPLVIGNTIYAEPWAYDLFTGQPKTRLNPVTGEEVKWQMFRPGHHCGNMAASKNYLFFRSATIAYYDLLNDYGTSHFRGQRPGCWINFIPANGLVLIPEASSGCTCPYALQCTVVLHPRKINRSWGIFSAPGMMTPVKHLAINFGAPGDRKGPKKTLWLGYPRFHRLWLIDIIKRLGGKNIFPFECFDFETNILKEGGYYGHNPDAQKIKNTDKPWIFTYGCEGLTKCVIPLIEKGQETGTYTVRLSFAEPANTQPGQRVFDIKLQDKVLKKNFDIFKEAGGMNKAIVKEFNKIKVNDKLKIELISNKKNPLKQELPVLNGIEIVRDAP
jgi:outer membrane protein assembly factor BamB